jgi:peptide chain release factor 2
MLDYSTIQKAKIKLENIRGLVDSRREELNRLKTAQEKEWNNIAQNKKIRALQDFLDEFDGIKKDIDDFLELTGVMTDAELTDEFHRVTDEFDAFYIKTLLVGKYDACDCVLNISAGAGGTEAQDWAEMVMRMQVRFAENQGFEYEITDVEEGDGAGIKGASIFISGVNAYGIFKGEAGVHRLVRISPFDSNKRRHTSFCAVEIVPQIEKTEFKVDEKDLRIDVYRASGAGGQHINKTESAVRITHIPTGVVCACQSQRSQIQNRDVCMKNLLSKLEYIHYENERRKLKNLQPIQMKIEWGSQIRSYVFCPYTLVKDHRTGTEDTNVGKVMDGDLKKFSDAYLLANNEEGL